MAPEDFSQSPTLKMPEAWAVGTYEWRPGSDQVDWSPELMRIYGVETSARSEHDFAEYVHPEDRSRVQAEASSYIGSKASGFSHTFRIVRPDGAVRLILDRGSIERDAKGRALLIRGFNVDITEEAEVNREVHERLRESEARFRMLFEAIDEGFCLLEVNLGAEGGRIDYRVTEANPAFYLRTGFPKSILGAWLREGAPDLEEEWYQLYGEVARTGEPKRFEQESPALGRWFDVYAFRIDTSAHPRVAVLFSDISDRKRHEEHNQLLMREVNHRSKNLLSVVQAIARQTAPKEDPNFAERFGGRLQALAAEQDLLVRNSWTTVPVEGLVRSQLSHFADGAADRIQVDGPDASLSPDAAQALGMALHELATNAAKYGALSNAAGRIDICWSSSGAKDNAEFVLTWVERDGPPVSAPERTGFGSVVTTKMVKMATGGNVVVDYLPEGLSWKLTCPAGRVLQG